MSERLFPEWHGDGFVDQDIVLKRVAGLIDKLGIENQVVIDDCFLYVTLDGFQFRFAVSLIDAEELGY